MRELAADLLLVLHAALAAFIVCGLVLVWIGVAAGWRWIRNPAFRYAQLGAIGVVALEAAAGLACPLTVWEDLLRGQAEPRSFLGRLAYELLYWDAPEAVFTVLHLGWAAASALTFILVPPRR